MNDKVGILKRHCHEPLLFTPIKLSLGPLFTVFRGLKLSRIWLRIREDRRLNQLVSGDKNCRANMKGSKFESLCERL
jgi:hypothetical protein